MKKLAKIRNSKNMLIEKDEMNNIIGGLSEATYSSCQSRTEPTQSCPCGDISTTVNIDGSINWSSTFIDCIVCPA